MTTSPTAGRRHLASSPFQPEPQPPIEDYAFNDLVSHDTYGMGRIISMEAHAATVDFGSQKVRVTSPFHKMSKL